MENSNYVVSVLITPFTANKLNVLLTLKGKISSAIEFYTNYGSLKVLFPKPSES